MTEGENHTNHDEESSLAETYESFMNLAQQREKAETRAIAIRNIAVAAVWFADSVKRAANYTFDVMTTMPPGVSMCVGDRFETDVNGKPAINRTISQ